MIGEFGPTFHVGGELLLTSFPISGFYSRTCTQCNITHNTTLILTCLCNGIDEDPVVSSLDLSRANPLFLNRQSSADDAT